MDVVVTVPKTRWEDWLAEGDLPGDPNSGHEYGFELGGHMPDTKPGDCLYIVAHAKLRGYAPLVDIVSLSPTRFILVRAGGAVAVTIPEKVIGFMGWRYRWWDRAIETPFPDWKIP